MTGTLTKLEPLSAARAGELAKLIRTASEPGKALALDCRGVVQRVIEEDDASAEQCIGDLDVHA